MLNKEYEIYLLSNGWHMIIIDTDTLWSHPFTTKRLSTLNAVTLTQKWIHDGNTFNALPQTH